MNTNIFPFLGQQKYLLLLRMALGILMFIHGAARVYYNTIGDFGNFLEAKGFVLGFTLACMVTAFDLIGGSLLVIGYRVKWICLGFIGVLSLGIFLVHLPNGWFVVGHHSGGVEYSLLLILCFLLTASSSNKLNQKKLFPSKERNNRD